jgi:hypothetical protein
MGLISVGFGFMLFALLAHLKKAGTGRPAIEGRRDESHHSHPNDKLAAEALAAWSPVSH